MQVKQTLLAVAGVLVSVQAFAAPVTIANIQAAKAAGTIQETWVSGASASTYPMFDGFEAGCDANSVAIFTNNAATNTAVRPGSTGNFNAYACTRAGKVSVLYHTVAGGSLFAYTPHTLGMADANGFVDRLKNLSTNSTCAIPASANSFTTNLGTYPVYKGCALTGSTRTNLTAINTDTAPKLPAGGFSDVEASAFAGLAGNISAKGTESEAFVGQTFGVVVSTNLYRAMQLAQGMTAAQIAADTTFDPALAPNITSAQYTSIITLNGGYQTDWSPILGAAGAGKKIVLARRVPTSGTQASSNMYFLKNPCSAGFNAGDLVPAAASDSSASFVVTEGSSTGNVKTTITAANTAGDYAIGVVSAENDWRVETSSTNAQYRFVKLDGVSPEVGSQQGTQTVTGAITGATSNYYTARANAINGSYPFHMEMRSYVANTADTFGAALIPQIVASLATPSVCLDTNRGITLNPLGGSTCGATVVTLGTKFGNNCKAPQLF